MEKRPQAILLKFPGTNCDSETGRALRLAGFQARVVLFNSSANDALDHADLLVLPGGFSYGDYIAAGKVAQLNISRMLGDALLKFRDKGGLILGICNGFQILSRLGLLPEGTLIQNASGRFQCEWVTLDKAAENIPFLSGLPDQFELPIAHGEGRFVARAGQSDRYVREGLAPLVYHSDVNGSESRIAALQDETGRVFGLMPHPERFIHREEHYDPDWNCDVEWGWGYYFFRSIIAGGIRA